MTRIADPTPPDVPPKVTQRSIEEIAGTVAVDPRVTALVPGFDAPFFQAGLAGYSDGPMRLVARRHGCPFCVTEALLDQTLINGGKGRTREDPDLLAEECGTGDPDENRAAGLEDHPIAGQIMGTYPDEMARGAEILVDFGYEVIDVNLACPVKKVRRKSRGGHLLAVPEQAIEILRAVRAAVPARTPCTVKLRRAFDDTPAMARNFEEIFDAAYEIGYAWATVHCRTVEQKYLGPARWPFLVDLVRRYPDRLIFGSGDVWTVRDVFAMLEITGVKAVSIARGCIGNPWIFRQARQLMQRQSPAAPSVAEQRAALLDHFNLAVSLHGERGASFEMRKFGIRFAQHHPAHDEVKRAFIGCSSIAQWHGVVRKWYADEENHRD